LKLLGLVGQTGKEPKSLYLIFLKFWPTKVLNSKFPSAVRRIASRVLCPGGLSCWHPNTALTAEGSGVSSRRKFIFREAGKKQVGSGRHDITIKA